MNATLNVLFKSNKYLVLKSLISTEICNIFLNYAKFQSLHDLISQTEDGHLVGTHSKYADFLTEALLLKFHPQIEAFIGESLFPSYSFFRVYKKGDKLEPHIDREACEISVTVCFGWPNSPTWPFKLSNRVHDIECETYPNLQDTIVINLEPGDALIYEGTKVKHWRDPLEHEKHVQMFLHYVRADGPYAHLKYDERDGIGIPRVSSAFEYVKYSGWMQALIHHLSHNNVEIFQENNV